MIEKLDKYQTSSMHTVIDKINEIIDFLNDTFLMRVKDGNVLGVCNDTPIFVTGLSMVDDTIRSDLESVTTVTSDIKCPYCGESYYTIKESLSTCVYYPPVIKDGVNINPDRNTSTTRCRCLNCQMDFTI